MLWGKGVPEGLLVKVVALPEVFPVRRRVSLGKEVLPMQWVVQGLLALLVVIRHMCLVVSPPSVKVVGLKVVGRVVFDTGAGVGGKFLPEVVGGGGGEVVGKGGGTGAGTFCFASIS